MRRRNVLISASTGLPLIMAAGSQDATAPRGDKVFRYALNFAETGFDPPRVSDQSSIRVLAHIFEPPLAWDPLARPAKLVPLVAAALPEISSDFKRFTFTLRQGIYFADDPAFNGQPRELVSADFVYSIKRFFDPEIRTEHLYAWENAKILGMNELRKRVLAQKKPSFPYDEEVPGLRALSRYRFELRLAEPAPRLANTFASATFASAVAREVVERYAADPNAHPVGTGPFVLHSWRRASRIVLVKNPRFREQRFAGEPSEGDAAAEAIAKRLAGVRAPLVDRLEFDVIEESQPRWLAFLNGEHDAVQVPVDLAPLAVPGGRLAPYLAKRGVQLNRQMAPSVAHTFFNFDDPLVGGYTPDKVALRRAIMLAYDSALEARLVRGGQAVAANSMIPPGCYGADENLVSEMSRSNPARAAALLDLHGYVDHNRDGWRERPDGQPLTLRIAFPQDQRSRRVSELWLKRMSAVGLRTQFEVGTFGELIRKSLAGQLMMWGFTWSGGTPDGDFFLGLAYGPNAEQSNDARFKLAAFDRLYERQKILPNGPERLALMREANKLMLAYVPYIAHLHEITNDLMHAHVRGPMRQPFGSDWFRWVDVEMSS